MRRTLDSNSRPLFSPLRSLSSSLDMKSILCAIVDHTKNTHTQAHEVVSNVERNARLVLDNVSFDFLDSLPGRTLTSGSGFSVYLFTILYHGLLLRLASRHITSVVHLEQRQVSSRLALSQGR